MLLFATSSWRNPSVRAVSATLVAPRKCKEGYGSAQRVSMLKIKKKCIDISLLIYIALRILKLRMCAQTGSHKSLLQVCGPAIC